MDCQQYVQFIDWLKEVKEEEFLQFCLFLIENGLFGVFSLFLKHHLVDSQRYKFHKNNFNFNKFSLENLAHFQCNVEEKLKLIIQVLKTTNFDKSICMFLNIYFKL